jgi:hypothetical protein
MLERFSFFLAHFPVFIEHNSKDDPLKLRRYDVGLRRLRLLRRIAQPFAWGPHERARETGEQVYAFLVPVTDDSRTADMPDEVRFEYLAGTVKDRSQVTLFAYIWFNSLMDAKEYVKNKGMTVVGGWHEHD